MRVVWPALIQKNHIFLPDFRFSGGLMTRDLERLTLSDLRLTSRRKVVAFSCIRWMGRLVGVTQYCAANILTSFRTHCFRTSIKIHQSTFSITVNFFSLTNTITVRWSTTDDSPKFLSSCYTSGENFLMVHFLPRCVYVYCYFLKKSYFFATVYFLEKCNIEGEEDGSFTLKINSLLMIEVLIVAMISQKSLVGSSMVQNARQLLGQFFCTSH